MARYYSSAMGRFMSPDWSAKVEPVPYSKLEFPQTLNLYVYVLNNPLIHTDPDGHACGGSGQPPCGGNQPGEQLQAVKDLHAAISPPPEDFSRGDMAVEPSHASYSITTGQISLVDTDAGKSTVIGTGYSGKGDGLNNPSMENVPGSKASPVAGPLPEGKYTIGKQQDNVTGSGTKLAGSERLTPQGGSDMHGRGGFLIHGDNARQNNSASEGCIVTSRATRDAIGASGDRTLDVDR
jgi:RHS repeat-associated protein